MRYPEHLNDALFHEHLAHFERRLGVTFEPHGIRLPTGHRITTAMQSLDIRPHHGTIDRYLYANVPTESGNLHPMSARLIGDEPHMYDTLDLNIGRGGSGPQPLDAWYQPRSDAPSGRHRDPEHFARDVHRVITESPMPPREKLEENQNIMRRAKEHWGSAALVMYDPQPGNRRYYNFHAGTGRLEER